MGEISGGGSRQGQEEIKRPDPGPITFAGRYEMTAAAKCHQTLLWGVPEGRRSPKGRSVGTGRVLLALEVAADAIQEARANTCEDGGLKRRLAPSSTARSPRARANPVHLHGAWLPMPSQQLHHQRKKNRDANVRVRSYLRFALLPPFCVEADQKGLA
jgi:hypothetical protein